MAYTPELQPTFQFPVPQEKVPPPQAVQHDPASDHSDEDSLALLPRGTVVRIIGNNRTKQSYIGLTAVVRRAVGLGGWHWLVLQTGEEIKLQRNALLVLEHPTGNEYYSEDEREEEARRAAAEQAARQRAYARQQQLEALEYEDSRVRHRRAPRPMIADEYPAAAPSHHHAHSQQYHHMQQPQHQQAGPAHAPPEAQAPRVSVRSLHQPRIDLGKLDEAALRRYRHYYRLPEPGAGTKDDLVSLVAQHFAEQTVDEAQVISHFLRAAKRHSAHGTTWRR